MNVSSAADDINRRTMRESVDFYAGGARLNAPERRVIGEIADEAKGKPILDLGVGGGRTTHALLQISGNYIGVDYMSEMVDACRVRFPGVKFECADARSMPQFADRSFGLIVFASNGVCMVDHAGRMAIFKEVRRLLAAGGVFVFSAYNRNCTEFEQGFAFPPFDRYTRNPFKLAARITTFFAHTLYSFANRLRFVRHEVHEKDYAIINDRCHHYRTLLYYTTMENQLKQLKEAGFDSAPTIYDISGNSVGSDTRSDSLTYVVRA